MQSLEDWERTGEDRRPDQLRSYIKELRLRGETFQGVTRITRTYGRHCDDVNDENAAFGRSYGPYLSLQNITREARFFATRHLGEPVKEADIHNAQPTCLWLSLIEHLGEEECSRSWPLLQRFVSAPDVWRAAIAEYFTVDIPSAKRLVLQIMFHGRTTPVAGGDELPVLIGLKAEIASSAKFLETNDPLYTRIRRTHRVLNCKGNNRVPHWRSTSERWRTP